MFSFFYFLQVLNNWPRVLMITWSNFYPDKNSDENLKENNLKLEFKYENQAVWGNNPIWNDPNQNQQILVQVSLKIQGNLVWRIFEDQKLFKEIRNFKEIHLKIDPTKTWSLEIFQNSRMILSKNFPTFWLAAIGDSFSSGQGNPAKSIPKWLDEPCYRSRNSFVFKTFEKIREKCSIFTFLSCSGASVDNGILSKNGQIEKLENLMKIRKSSPDSLILTVGGNDIGFTDILSQIQEENFSEISINMRFFYVFHQLDRIAAKLAELKIPQIILVNYYDITRNENGEVDASCGKFGKVSQLNLILAERRILRRLNELLRRKAEKYGWELVDISEIFRRRGLCSKNSLIRSRNESLALQSNDYGSFHPNIEGHRLISEKLVSHLT